MINRDTFNISDIEWFRWVPNDLDIVLNFAEIYIG